MKQKLLTLLFICLALGSSKCLADVQPNDPETLPQAPTAHPNDVLAVFSDYYVWGIGKFVGANSKVAKESITSADGITVLKVQANGNGNWLWANFKNGDKSAEINLTDYETMEFDIYSFGYLSDGTPTDTQVKIRLNENSSKSTNVFTRGEWHHFSFPLSGMGTRTAVTKLGFAIQSGGGSFLSYETHKAYIYIYNIYFKKSTTTGNVVGESKATVPVTSYGWASVCFPYDVTIPDGVEAYYAKAAAGSTITLKKVMDMIPAGEGVIVKASEGNEEFTKTEGAAAIADNLFVGTTSAGLVNQGENYVLSGVNEGNPVFKLFSEGDGKVCMPPFKAYLPSRLVGSGARTLNFVFEEETNAIRNVVEKTQNYKKVMENGRFFIYHCDKKYNAAGQLMKQ